MAEGLKIQVGADVTQAEKALDKLSREVKKTGAAIGTDLSKSVNTGTRALDKIPQSTNRATASLSSIGRAVNTGSNALEKLPQSSNRATFALTNFSRVVQDAPFGIIGIANNIDPLVLSFQQLRRETGSASGAFKALASSLKGGGGIALGVSLITSGLIVFGDKLFGAGNKIKDFNVRLGQLESQGNAAKESLDGLAKSIDFVTQFTARFLNLSLGEGPQLDLALARNELGGLQDEFVKLGPAIQEASKRASDAYGEFLKTANRSTLNQINELFPGTSIRDIPESFISKLSSDEQEAFNIAKKLYDDLVAIQGQQSDALNKILLKKKDITILTLKQEADAQKEAAEKYKQYVEDIIAEGKRLADELRKIGFIAPEFNFFDTQAQQLEKARKVIGDFAAGILKIDPNFFKIPLEIQAPRPDSVKPELDQLQKGIQAGIIRRPIEIPVELSEREEQNARIIEQFQKLAAQKGLRLTIPVDLDLKGSIATTTRVLSEQLNNVQRKLELAKLGADALTNSFQGFFNAILQGESPLKAFFQSLGQELLRLISQLIAAQIRALILRAILGGGSGNVGAALPVGNFGITGFASGGIVSGPTLALVGEGIGTSRSNPEVIAPLDQLRSILESVVAGRGGGGGGIMTARIRGNDLLLSNSRTSRQNRRLGSG